jgi:hypothetical protein
MSPYTKAVRAAFRVLALGCMLVSLGLYANDIGWHIFLHWSDRPPSGFLLLALKGLPFLGGAVLFWKSRAIAEHFTRDLD